MMILEDENIRLRAIEPEDLELFYRWENDTKIWENSISFAPYSRYMLKRYIEQTNNNLYTDNQLRLMIELKDDSRTPIGCIDIYDFDAHNQHADWGIVIDEKFRGKGYARKAVTLMNDYCFNVLNLNMLYCKVLSKNISCVKMLQMTGHKQVGILEKWAKTMDGFADAIIFQKVKTVKK